MKLFHKLIFSKISDFIFSTFFFVVVVLLSQRKDKNKNGEVIEQKVKDLSPILCVCECVYVYFLVVRASFVVISFHQIRIKTDKQKDML